jgi:DNA-binding transcriptional ArsR family regulator
MPRSGSVPHNELVGLSTDTLNAVEDRELDLTFAALADPTRRAILARLARGPATVNVLAEPFEMSLQSISRHLKVLEGAGLITRGRDAQFRPCTFREAPLEGAADWIAETWAMGRAERQRTGVLRGERVSERPDGRPDERPGEQLENVPSGSAFATRGDWAR